MSRGVLISCALCGRTLQRGRDCPDCAQQPSHHLLRVVLAATALALTTKRKLRQTLVETARNFNGRPS